jgi:hypothetical protein
VAQQVGLYQGKVPNPHILRGQEDIETGPLTFNRIGTRWGDVQLKNGWGWTNFGRRMTGPAAGYLVAVVPTIPGQTRLIGKHSGDFPARGPAPSQWQQYVDSTTGMMPSYPGGPGQSLGAIVNRGNGA